MFNFKTDLIDKLYTYGVYDVVLPFLLVFTIVFAFLEKTHVLGKATNTNTKKFNVVVAVVMGILATRVPWFVLLIQNALPKVGVTIIGVLMFILLIAMFTGVELGMPKAGWIRMLILLLPAVAVGYYFLSEFYNYFPYVGIIGENIQTIIVLGVFAIILFAITSSETKKLKPYGTNYGSEGKGFDPRTRDGMMWDDFLNHNKK